MSYLRKKLDRDALKKKTSELLHKGFDSAACKVTLKLTIPRLKILRNKKEAQLKALKREVAQLLETGQEASARVKVEHVIREEKLMSAYELIELYCEIIVARLPIIESQKQCPTDLKEAVASVIFAQQRCSDLAELKDVRKHLSQKYGKDFANAAAELWPESGVSTLLVEKLSIKSPNTEAKVKALTTIAAEHGIDWKPKSFEEGIETKEALLSGPTSFESAEKLVSESAKPEVVQVVEVSSPVKHQVPSTQASSNSGFSNVDTPTISSHERRVPEPTLSKPEILNVQTEEQVSMLQQQYWRMNFKDAATAAEAAARSAELANMAAIAAANLAARGNVSAEQAAASVEDISTSSRVSLQSKQPEQTVQQPLQMDYRIKDRYRENSMERGTFQGGLHDNFRRESKKEYYGGNSNSNSFSRPMSGPTPTFVNDPNKPDGMLRRVDGTFHEKGSVEHISVGRYQESEVMDHNVHIEADRVKSNRYQSSRCEDPQASRTTTGTPPEELERKFEHSQRGDSFNRTTAGTPAEELERKFEHSQRGGSFSRTAISQTTSDIASHTRSSSRMSTSVSDRVVDDNTDNSDIAGIRVQDSVDMPSSGTSVQATFRDNSQQERNKRDVDCGRRSTSSSSTSSSFLPSSEVVMQADLHPEKIVLAEPSSSHEDFANDYYMETPKDDMTKDLLSRPDSSRSGKDFYGDDWYQWDHERQDDDTRNPFYEEVMVQSLRGEAADFHKEDAKGAHNYFPSSSNRSPFVDVHNDFPSSANSPFVDEAVSSPSKKDYSFNHHSAPTFDDDDRRDGSEIIDFDNTARSSESRDSAPHFSPAPPGPQGGGLQGRMLAEPSDDASFKFDDHDDFDNVPDKQIDIFSPSNWKDRSQSHQAEQELLQSPFRKEESKRSEMLYQDSSSGLLPGRRRWNDPRENLEDHYTQEEAKVPGQSKISMEEPPSFDDEDSGGEQRLDLQTPLTGGLKNKPRVPFSRRTRGSTMGPSRGELLSKKSDQVPDDVGSGSRSSTPSPNLDMDMDPQSVRRAGSGRRGLSWQDISDQRPGQQPQVVSSGDKAIPRRRNVSMEEPPRRQFLREESEDRRLKSGERAERGFGGSVPAYDPEIDEEMDRQPLHPRRRTQGFIREPKTGIPENDLVGDNVPDVKAKPHTKVSAYAPSADRRSTPAPEDADLTLQMGPAKIPPLSFSQRAKFTEKENKTSKISGSAADQSGAVKVDVNPIQTRTDEQQPLLIPPRDSLQKEPSADLSQTSSSSSSKEEPGSPNSTSGREPKVLRHVHPKLPTDYDSFAANFQKFRANARWK